MRCSICCKELDILALIDICPACEKKWGWMLVIVSVVVTALIIGQLTGKI